MRPLRSQHAGFETTAAREPIPVTCFLDPSGARDLLPDRALAITGAIVFVVESREPASENTLTMDRNRLTAYGALGIVGGLGLSLVGLLFWHRSSSVVEVN